jgi:hypothetical protein
MIEQISFDAYAGALRALSLASRLVERTIAYFIALLFGIVRPLTLAGLAACALLDAMYSRLIIPPNGTSLARARARWLHRWSRAAGRVLGIRILQKGFTPVSGMVALSHKTLLDAILLAATRPCVFVVRAGIRKLPLVGLLARLGGAIFVDSTSRRGLLLANFQIQRALHRRLVVVIFPGCGGHNAIRARIFSSALFEPAAELGCTLTAAAIDYHDGNSDLPADYLADGARMIRHALRVVTRPTNQTMLSFSSPAFHSGNRKQLALQLWGEAVALTMRTSVRAFR